MSRINTNIPSLIAARVFNQQNERLASTLERLSTGLRINKGKDDPAGLIASEALRSDITAIGAAITNARRADNIIATAEGALGEVNSLILELEDLVDRTANEAALSDEEVKANQLQIDSILDTINRISSSTSFAGKELLNGSLDYSLSSVSSTQLGSVQVNAARIADGATRTVNVAVTTSAQTGQLAFSASGLGATNAVTIEITGNLGTENFSFAGSTTITTIRDAVNATSDLTGVSATLSGTDALLINSTSYGSDQFVSVNLVTGTFALTDPTGSAATRDFGTDVVATINGQSVTGSGLDLTLNTASLGVDISLDATFAQSTGTTSTFGITGGGATFSLAPELGLVGRQSIGIGSVSTGSLGKSGIGFLASLASGQANALLEKNFLTSQRVIRAARDEVSSLRGRLGSFQKDTIQSTINSLQVTLENTAAAESAIRDADFAAETGRLTRSQILVAAASSSLQLANAAPQSVLALLG